VLRVARPLASGAFDVHLVLAIELLHDDRRAPAGGERPAQSLEPEPMLLAVVMHFAEQHDRVAAHPRLPIRHVRRARACRHPEREHGGERVRRAARHGARWSCRASTTCSASALAT
jgi:hypothetical protein